MVLVTLVLGLLLGYALAAFFSNGWKVTASNLHQTTCTHRTGHHSFENLHLHGLGVERSLDICVAADAY